MIITVTSILLTGFSLSLASPGTLNQNQVSLDNYYKLFFPPEEVAGILKMKIAFLQVSLGQTKYSELTRSSAQPRYGACWLSALRQLETKCDVITEETHSR